jgi:phenazine biosynthesis protein phzE
VKTQALFTRVLGAEPPPFALIHRPGSGDPDRIELLLGEVSEHESIADIPLPHSAEEFGHELVVVVPYRQVRERGFAAREDDAPLLAIAVNEQAEMSVRDALELLPDDRVSFVPGGFSLDDAAYGGIVRRILSDEIGRGTGANFVIKRTFEGDIANWSARAALSVFRRLLGRDAGSYWTFLVNTGQRFLIGSSPERHVSLIGDRVAMNPISGTLRHAPSGPVLDDVLEFLADEKEAAELYMVLDEELKMMAQVCDRGCRARGPYLRQMARLAHTEYVIEGRSSRDVREVLRRTLLAPTVTGGPLESACRVIARYEPEGRGYYAGVLALIGRDPDGTRRMDSTIIIRTADVNAAGHLRLSVGATLVRDSDPLGECHETRAKASSLLDALADGACRESAAVQGGATRLSAHPAVARALAARNRAVASFWFEDPAARRYSAPELVGRELLVIDAEDSFTSMARQMIESLGCAAIIRQFDEPLCVESYDAVILGPGPGDPNDDADPKIQRMRALARELLHAQVPFFAVCLGHQVLCSMLGLPVKRKRVPSQGVQEPIEIFGARELVGFYNTFAAWSATDQILCPQRCSEAQVFRDPRTGEVHGLRGPGFASIQFHAASVLTPRGVELLGGILSALVAGEPPASTSATARRRMIA